jgi:hypothetical protein
MGLTARWSGVIWGTNNGPLVIEVAEDPNHQLHGTVSITEEDGITLFARLRGAVQGNNLMCDVDHFTGPPNVQLPNSARLTAIHNPATQVIEGNWATDIGTTGRIVLFKLLMGQLPHAPFATFAKTLTFGPCRMDQGQVQTLVNLIKKDVTPNAEPGINVLWDGKNAVKTGLKEVIDDPNIPSILNDMLIVASYEQRRHVNVTFKKSDSNILFVSGEDNIWVEGKAAEISAYIGRHENKLARVLKKYGSNLNSLIFLLLLALLPGIASARNRLLVVGFVFALLLSLAQFWTITPYAKLFIRTSEPSWYERNSATLWISLITGLLTVVIGYLLDRFGALEIPWEKLFT